MTDLETLYAAVRADPLDPVRRLAVADCLEEQGLPRHAAGRPWRSTTGGA